MFKELELLESENGGESWPAEDSELHVKDPLA